jgi:hypothetical protein
MVTIWPSFISLDHFGGLDRHLVRQLGHRDGFGHVHFDDPGFHRCGLLVIVALIAVVAAAATRATTPVVAPHAAGLLSPRVLISFFLAGSPAQLEDSLADLTSLPAPGRAGGWCGAPGRGPVPLRACAACP